MPLHIKSDLMVFEIKNNWFDLSLLERHVLQTCKIESFFFGGGGCPDDELSNFSSSLIIGIFTKIPYVRICDFY